MRKKNRVFFEGIAYRLGQLQSNINCIKCRDKLHLLEIEINQYLLVESLHHRKKYYKDDLKIKEVPSKMLMKQKLREWKDAGNI